MQKTINLYSKLSEIDRDLEKKKVSHYYRSSLFSYFRGLNELSRTSSNFLFNTTDQLKTILAICVLLEKAQKKVTIFSAENDLYSYPSEIYLATLNHVLAKKNIHVDFLFQKRNRCNCIYQRMSSQPHVHLQYMAKARKRYLLKKVGYLNGFILVDEKSFHCIPEPTKPFLGCGNFNPSSLDVKTLIKNYKSLSIGAKTV